MSSKQLSKFDLVLVALANENPQIVSEVKNEDLQLRILHDPDGGAKSTFERFVNNLISNFPDPSLNEVTDEVMEQFRSESLEVDFIQHDGDYMAVVS